MNRIELFFAKWLARRVVRQGSHKARITELYQVIRGAAEDEFTEDNAVTLNAFLLECYAEGA